ncbi:MAG TPA: hypothetical protein VM098_01720 [Phycisphaerae bacterium]|nr:hypothetical protein [Phycisphaerae bacterium]
MPQRGAEELAVSISNMRRAELIRLLRGMHCSFDLDFTDEFLKSVGLSRLRHILLAAALHDRSTTVES